MISTSQHDVAALLARIEELEAENARLSISDWFNCLTRNAVKEQIARLDPIGKAIVYLDIDHLKEANNRWGKIESSRRIRESIVIRHQSTDRPNDVTPFIGQYFSGDEFVAIMDMRDAMGYAERTQLELIAREMSATFVIVACHDLAPMGEQINYAEELMKDRKDGNHRGTIAVLPC